MRPRRQSCQSQRRTKYLIMVSTLKSRPSSPQCRWLSKRGWWRKTDESLEILDLRIPKSWKTQICFGGAAFDGIKASTVDTSSSSKADVEQICKQAGRSRQVHFARPETGANKPGIQGIGVPNVIPTTVYWFFRKTACHVQPRPWNNKAVNTSYQQDQASSFYISIEPVTHKS